MLDRLISEIANLLQIPEEDVRSKFTQEQLNRLYEESKCEDPGLLPSFIDSLETPCQDSGTQFDPSTELSDVNFPDQEEPFDVLECKEAADKVNEEIKRELEEYNDTIILLEKLVEFQDHLKVVGFYYDARAHRIAEVLKDFRPLLEKKKELESKISNQESLISSLVTDAAAAYVKLAAGDISSSEYNSTILALNNKKKVYADNKEKAEKELKEVQTKLDNKSDSYSVLNASYSGSITSIGPNSTVTALAQFNTNSSLYISSSDFNSLKEKLKSYSEHIKLSRNNSTSYDNIIKNPRIEFEVDLQGLDYIKLEKEKYNEETGKRSTYTENFLIANNPLIKNNSFKNSVAGCKISNKSPKEKSSGVLYTGYYNKLSDPMNEFFTLDEKGLTEEASQLDPILEGSENTKKKEGGKEYFIKDLNRMNSFYETFDKKFEEKKAKVKKGIEDSNLTGIKSALSNIAYRDIDLLLATAGFNTNLAEDSSELNTLVNSVKNANVKFSKSIKSIDDEITRLKLRAEELKPTQEKVKKRLAAANSKCFKEEEETAAECSDVKEKLGSDPLYLKDIDGSLPNFTQICYWREFAKVANIMGLAPIPNGPTELRYWPVGLVIPTPATLVKIPLPIIWIPIICISTPLGVIVTFLTVNGLFISPIIFYVSTSGHKQHILTVRGPSPKFGADKQDELFKSGISIPVGVKASADKAARKAKDLKLPQEDLDRLESLKQKKQELLDAGDNDRAKRAEEKIKKLEKKKEDLGKSSSEIAADFLDKTENAKSTIQEIKADIKKKIDALGRPQTKKVEDLKNKATRRREDLQEKYLKALEAGDNDLANELREKLKKDGLTLDEKLDAIMNDILDYFEDLDLPKITIPKEESKVNPMPPAGSRMKFDVPAKISKFRTQAFSKKDKSVKTILKMDLAKYRKEIDKEIGVVSFDMDLENVGEKIADVADKMLNAVIKQITKVENRPALGFTPDVIAQLSALKVDLDPFAPCCAKPAVEIDLGPASAIVYLFNSTIPLITSGLKSMDPNQLKSLFGGKRTVSTKDIRLSLNSLIEQNVPDSLQIDIPEFGLPQLSAAVNTLLSMIQIPQADFPAAMKALTIPKQISIDFNTVVKPPLVNLLKTYISKNIQAFPRDIEADFIGMSGADLKGILTRFIDVKFDEIESYIDPIYKAISFAKSAKNIDLNVVEKSLHKIPPYGKAIESAYTAIGLTKMNLPNSLAYSEIDLEALKAAIRLLEPVLSPIVKSPIGYITVAVAGATGNIDKVKKFHPVLNYDDIPAWERLTVFNVLLLVFLDEFIYEASNKVGFFRTYV